MEMLSELDLQRLLPDRPVWLEIKWSRQMGYHEHAERLQRLMDEEWEEGGEDDKG